VGIEEGGTMVHHTKITGGVDEISTGEEEEVQNVTETTRDLIRTRKEEVDARGPVTRNF